MNIKIFNRNIRSFLKKYITIHGKTNTRVLIDLAAKHFNTSKQRIAGNISALVRYFGYTIVPNPPTSFIY